MSSRVGLIGGGRWGTVHRDALAASGGELAAVLVSSEATAKRLRREWALPVETDMEAFLAVPSDAVIVASPNYLHARHALAALAAGRHVLVEKPMAIAEGDCQAIVQAAGEAGLVLAVGHEMRVFRLFEEVKRRVVAGEIGAPVHLKLDLWRRPYRAGSGGWKADPGKLGSSILEEPIHYLDLARWYLGPAVQVQAWANSRPGREEMWENLEVRLEHETGSRSWVTRSIAGFGHQVALSLVGSEGSLRATWRGKMDMDPQPLVELDLEGTNGMESVPIPRETGHAYDVPRQTARFLAALEGNRGPAASGHDGCEAVRLCLAAQHSLQQGSTSVAV